MRDDNIEQISLQNCEEGEIDLCQCLKLFAKRKKAFVGVFLFVFGIGFYCFLSAPEIYRTSILVYPVFINEAFIIDNNSKDTKDLKDLIINNAFRGALRERLSLDPNKNNLEFNAEILNESDILKVSIDLESKEKKIGRVILQNLFELISESYVKRMETEEANIVSRLKLVFSAKEKAKSLQEQINGATSREDKLSKEKELISANTAQDSTTALLLADQIQDTSSYLSRINNKLGELSLRKEQLGPELENINSQITDLEMEIDKLKINKDSIPSLRMISQPEISPTPVSSRKIKTLGLFLVMGLLSGALAVFLQECWVSKLKKHD